MFNKIQHIGYQVRNLDTAAMFFEPAIEAIEKANPDVILNLINAYEAMWVLS